MHCTHKWPAFRSTRCVRQSLRRTNGGGNSRSPTRKSEVLVQMDGNATNSLLKNCFGSPFRAAKRRGTSLFVGFWRAVIPYCAHSSTFEILFQQAVSRVTVHLKENFTFPIRALSLTTPTVGRSSRDLVLLGHLYLAIDPASFWPSPRRRTYEHSSRYPSKCYSGPNSEIVTHGSPV